MPLLDQIGLTLDSFSISWGLSDAEVYSIERKQAEFEEEGLEFAKKREIAHLRREQEIEKARLSNLQELKLAKSRGDEDLQDLLLAGEIRRDLLLKGSEVDTAKIEAQVREIQIGIERSESLARLEQRRAEEEFRLDLEDHEFKQKHEARLASLEAEDREMRSMVRMQIEMATAKHERQTAESRQKIDAEFRRLQAEVEDRYQQRKLKLDESMARMGMMERLVSQGLHSGAADSSVLNTMLRQATEQEYATTSDEKVKARAAAEAAANNLDTYRKAEDRDRQYHGTMTDLASGLMHAAKPAPREDRSRDPMQSTGHQGPYVSGNPFPPGSRNSCPSCRTPVQANWKACPECGASLHPNQKINCRNCGSPVDRAWKACPACGHTLEPHCRQCGNPVEAEWKACPSCGTSR
ncbi:MAG: zinc ribbon domain-containing protein [Opitutales bacterium]|nr:zinc ribbon domain-containing protein [Opitutales bacterium]